jgi:hypothetical protein
MIAKDNTLFLKAVRRHKMKSLTSRCGEYQPQASRCTDRQLSQLPRPVLPYGQTSDRFVADLKFIELYQMAQPLVN